MRPLHLSLALLGLTSLCCLSLPSGIKPAAQPPPTGPAPQEAVATVPGDVALTPSTEWAEEPPIEGQDVISEGLYAPPTAAADWLTISNADFANSLIIIMTSPGEPWFLCLESYDSDLETIDARALLEETEDGTFLLMQVDFRSGGSTDFQVLDRDDFPVTVANGAYEVSGVITLNGIAAIRALRHTPAGEPAFLIHNLDNDEVVGIALRPDGTMRVAVFR